MSRDLDDPNELVGQKRRRKIGSGAIQQSSQSESEIAKESDIQPLNKPTPQQSSHPDSQQVNCPIDQIVSNSASQVANHVDSLPAIKPASQQSSNLAIQKAKRKKQDREQQAIYLPPEQRQILKLLMVLEKRDLSDIVEDALSLYIEQSAFKSVLPALIEAQEQKGH